MSDRPYRSRSVPWKWLLTCRACGKVHEWRPRDPKDPKRGGTWAAPGVYDGRSGSRGGPGHGYEPRVDTGTVSKLRAEYNAVQSAHSTTEET